MPYILDITLVVVKSGVCIVTMINLSSSKGRWLTCVLAREGEVGYCKDKNRYRKHSCLKRLLVYHIEWRPQKETEQFNRHSFYVKSACHKEPLPWGRSRYRPAVRQYVTRVTACSFASPSDGDGGTLDSLLHCFPCFFVYSRFWAE